MQIWIEKDSNIELVLKNPGVLRAFAVKKTFCNGLINGSDGNRLKNVGRDLIFVRYDAPGSTEFGPV